MVEISMEAIAIGFMATTPVMDTRVKEIITLATLAIITNLAHIIRSTMEV